MDKDEKRGMVVFYLLMMQLADALLDLYGILHNVWIWVTPTLRFSLGISVLPFAIPLLLAMPMLFGRKNGKG